MKTKKLYRDKRQNIKFKKENKKKVSEKEKIIKLMMRHQILLKKILDYNKDAQKKFLLASKLDKGKSEPKLEKSIVERTKLKNEKIAEIKKEEKNMNYELFKKYFTNYLSPSDMYKKLRETEGDRNEDQVYSIKEVLNRIKEAIKNVPGDRKYMTEENEKIINIVECILYFDQLEQQGQGLKILTPNQMLSRLTYSLAQLKAGNNSEKPKNEIRQLLYSLYRSKKITKQLYKSLIDII